MKTIAFFRFVKRHLPDKILRQTLLMILEKKISLSYFEKGGINQDTDDTEDMKWWSVLITLQILTNQSVTSFLNVKELL